MASNPEVNANKHDDETNPWPYINRYFKFIGRSGKNYTFLCKICEPKKKNISANCKSLFNLKSHITRQHKKMSKDFDNCVKTSATATKGKKRLADETEDLPKAKQEKQLTVSRIVVGPSINVPQGKVDELVINLVVEEMLPFKLVESSAFKELIHTLQPKRSLMGRKALVTAIDEKYQKMMEEVKVKLSSVTYVATTADCWSCCNKAFLGVTAHWINPTTLERESAAIACRRIDASHTYNLLANELEAINIEYCIQNKITRTTTNNGSNFIKDIRCFAPNDGEHIFYSYPNDDSETLEDGNGDEDEDENSQVCVQDLFVILSEEQNTDEEKFSIYILPKHQRCASHTLNLVSSVDCNKSLFDNPKLNNVSRSSLAKMQALWNKQCRSTVAADTINAELKGRLLVPCAARWNSLYDALKRVCDVITSNEFGLHLICDELGISRLNISEICFIQEYVKVMQPICQAFNILQSDTNAYMGILLPTLTACIHKLQELQAQQLNICSSLPSALITAIEMRFDKQFSDIEIILAAAFHPKFKLTWIQDENKKVEVRELMIKTLNERLALESGDSSSKTNNDEESDDDYFSCFKKTMPVHLKSGSSQIAAFLDSPTARNFEYFPSSSFKSVFLSLNTAVPSSASVERVFSVGKDILRPKLSRLSDQHFEKLVLLKINK